MESVTSLDGQKETHFDHLWPLQFEIVRIVVTVIFGFLSTGGLNKHVGLIWSV